MFALNPLQGRKSPAMCSCLSMSLLSLCPVPVIHGSPTGQQPVKSPNDDYQYRLLTLDNQIWKSC